MSKVWLISADMIVLILVIFLVLLLGSDEGRSGILIILINFVALTMFDILFADGLMLDFHDRRLNFNRKSI